MLKKLQDILELYEDKFIDFKQTKDTMNDLLTIYMIQLVNIRKNGRYEKKLREEYNFPIIEMIER